MAESPNSSSICYPPPPSPPQTSEPFTAELVALRLLSSNLESLHLSPSLADAHISTRGTTAVLLPVHRCLLSARSPYFCERFAKSEPGIVLDVKDLVPDRDIGADSLRFVLGYMYSGRVPPLPKGASCCADDECAHVGCRPAVDFMLEVLYASLVFQIFELVNLFQRRLLDILHKVAEDDILAILSVAVLCGKHCEKLLTCCINFISRSGLDFVTLEKTLPSDIVMQIMDFRSPKAKFIPDIHVRRILRALDSDDVELLHLLLKENATTTLDEAYALHYAVAYCDSKITTDLLEFGIADVNLRNHRGYTVLHMAALRKEPSIIISLLTKGARPSDTTPDGRKAVQIARQVTKYSEFSRPLEQCITAPPDRLCIEILENAETTDPVDGLTDEILANAGKDLETQLHYLETRVGLARLLFPAEARIAMENAKANGTSEFTLATQFNALPDHQQPNIDDLIKVGHQILPKDFLNWMPFSNRNEHLSRAMALLKTVETAKRFFPRCTRVIDRYMDHDTIDLGLQGNETLEVDKQLKRKRFEELQQEFHEAFYQDKEALNASSSSTLSYKRSRAKSTRQKG